MSWTKPKAVEIRCGMEINMYGPAEDDDRPLF
jgi:coenzyme PQQ precursor peptide PqqA